MSDRESAVVLLSAGLDSAFNLFKSFEKLKIACALTFDYGQKAAQKEIERAREMSLGLQIEHKVVTLPWFREFTSTALVGNAELPQGQSVQIDDLQQSEKTARSVWVPNRNGILLNIAAGFAEGRNADYVVPGFNLEEAQTFPDNTGEFLKTLDSCWAHSTASHVRGYCFSTAITKTEIVREGLRMNLPFHRLWPCYLAGETWCGQCESCLRFRRAVEANGLDYDVLRAKSA